ncbi:hypothetical protein DOTSEDRAFT_74290 [Dothistroma septosporum NZE10]|uniref:Secreted protein n=1 Tax=Dothistroma septosporum (strain NZE10 / CBS 128990) TaxID=675120 RepID=N1PHD9_DOTSN|nr:hypothetical protein DOTSEDRAFT_74290 [Dothistroma septosporum NZE10]
MFGACVHLLQAVALSLRVFFPSHSTFEHTLEVERFRVSSQDTREATDSRACVSATIQIRCRCFR